MIEYEYKFCLYIITTAMYLRYQIRLTFRKKYLNKCFNYVSITCDNTCICLKTWAYYVLSTSSQSDAMNILICHTSVWIYHHFCILKFDALWVTHRTDANSHKLFLSSIKKHHAYHYHKYMNLQHYAQLQHEKQ